MEAERYFRNSNTNANGQQRQRTPGADIDSWLSQIFMPSAPDPTRQGGTGGMAPPASPGMQFGAPPSPQVASPEGKQQLINAMTAKAGGQMQGTGAAGSGLGGAMQGASLVNMLTGKSPVSAMKNALGLGETSMAAKAWGADPTTLGGVGIGGGPGAMAGGAMGDASVPDLFGGAGTYAGNIGMAQGAAPAMPQVADSAAGMASAGDATGALGMDGSQAIVDQLLGGGGEALASEAAPAVAELGTDAASEAALMEGGAAAAPETFGLSIIPGAVYGLGNALGLW
jgi:hypothetical protein